MKHIVSHEDLEVFPKGMFSLKVNLYRLSQPSMTLHLLPLILIISSFLHSYFIVTVKIAGRTVTVKGPRGSLTKSFDHAQLQLFFIKKGKVIRAEVWQGNRAALATARSIITHIRNMMIGVTRGFLYKMKLVSNHFPMSLSTENNCLEIRNFLGEKRVRSLKIPEGVTFERAKDLRDEIQLSGNDIDVVSQFCADIHTSTLVKGKDIRKFLDGIYVSFRGNVVEED